MSTFKDRGIILRTTDNKDYDKTLTALLENRGKVYLYAKGAKRQSSKLCAGSEPFSLAEFVVYEGSGFLSLAQIELIDNFYGIRSDYDIYIYSCFMLEVCDKIMQPHMDAKAALDLMTGAFGAFCKKGPNSFFIFIVYLLKLLKLEGYMPELLCCSNCSGETGKLYFAGSGLICGRCLAKCGRYISVDEETVEGLRYIYANDTPKLMRMNASVGLLKKLLRAALFFIEENLDIKLKSGDILAEGKHE